MTPPFNCPRFIRACLPARAGERLDSRLITGKVGVDSILMGEVRLTAPIRDHLNRLRSEPTQFLLHDTSRLGVIIPYRNRREHLDRFLPYIKNFLNEKGVDYRIIIVEQTDNLLFNRAALLNLGAKHCEGDCDALCFHDVDRLPVEVEYSVGNQPLSLLTQSTDEDTGKKSDYLSHYFGGITTVRSDQFREVNGYSNKFWGWGGEDDNLLFRFLYSGIEPCRVRRGIFLEMSHRPQVELSVDGSVPDRHERRKIRKSLKANRRYQSAVRRGVVDPWEDGLHEMDTAPQSLPSVEGCERLGVDLRSLLIKEG